MANIRLGVGSCVAHERRIDKTYSVDLRDSTVEIGQQQKTRSSLRKHDTRLCRLLRECILSGGPRFSYWQPFGEPLLQ